MDLLIKLILAVAITGLGHSAANAGAVKGQCYTANGNAEVCYLVNPDGSFSVAITDGKSPKPTILHFDCHDQFAAVGELPKVHKHAAALAICTAYGKYQLPAA